MSDETTEQTIADDSVESAAAHPAPAGGAPVDDSLADDGTLADAPVEPAAAEPEVVEGEIADGPDLAALVAERTADLQRLQAEYVNYKRRVDRDRELARQAGIERVVVDLLPVLDSIEMARGHDDVVGGFKMVADELEKVAGKYGLESFGEVGDPFDPMLHEALMQVPMEGVEVTTCSQVMQRGFQLHGKVLRPARVAVAEPQ